MQRIQEQAGPTDPQLGKPCIPVLRNRRNRGPGGLFHNSQGIGGRGDRAVFWLARQPPSNNQPAAAAPPPPPDFPKVEIKTTDLGDNVYMLEGQGGNITVAVAETGIIMVDGQYAPLHDKIKAAIATLSTLPIKYLINTHYHGDHVGGNELFAKDGALIVAQINVKNAPGVRHHQWPHRRQDAARARRRAARRHLHQLLEDPPARPRRRSQEHPERPH